MTLKQQIGSTDKEWLAVIDTIKLQERNVVLFGRGSTSEFILNKMEEYGLAVTAFCDNDPKKQGTLVAGRIPVISVETLTKEYGDTLIYITTQLYYQVIREQLLSEGIESERICEYDLIPQFLWESDYNKSYQRMCRQYEAIYDLLADDMSRKVLCNRIKFLITRRRSYAVEMRGKKQYFDLEALDYGKIKNFFDIGTFTGDSIFGFLALDEIKQHGADCNVFGFEPDEDLYQTACSNTSKENRVTLFKTGLSDYCGNSSFQAELGIMQTLENGIYKEEHTEFGGIHVATLDSLFSDKEYAFSFLKMDIEGAEVAALRGAEEFIRYNTPLIAVCVYHKEDDIIRITNYLKELVPEYRFYLRHYSDNQTETVLYAATEEFLKEE